MTTGIIDRFEGGFAVVELEGTMHNFPLTDAPEGLREGQVVQVENGCILCIDEDATARRAALLHNRFERLKHRR